MGILFISNHMSKSALEYDMYDHATSDFSDNLVGFLASGPALPLLSYLLDRGGSTMTAVSEILFRYALLSPCDTKLASILLSHGMIDVNHRVPGPWYFDEWDSDPALLPLEAAILSEDILMVRLLLNARADVNALGSRKESMLSIAVHASTDEILVALLQSDVQNTCPALPYFLRIREIESATKIVKEVAAQNSESKIHPCTLVLSAKAGCLELVQLLLDLKVDANAFHNGRTALIAASESGHMDIVKLLLPHVSDINAHEWRGTALSTAVGGGHIDIVSILLHFKADVNAYETHWKSALAEAIRATHLNIVELLLQHQHQAEILGAALETAVWSGNEAVVALLNRGLDLGERNLAPALHSALYRKAVSILEILLKHGTNPNVRSIGYYGQPNFDRTPLDMAIETQNLEAVDALLQHGGDPNCRSCSSRLNGFQSAVEHGNIELVRKLLQGVRDINAVHAGRSALGIAVEHGNIEVANLLLENEASTRPRGNAPSSLQIATARQDTEMIMMLLKYKADPNESEQRGLTAIATAVRLRDRKIIELLLQAGAQTALLHAAAEIGDFELLRLALNHKADVNGLSLDHKTAIASAIMSKEILQDDRCQNVILFLIDQGGKLNFPDDSSLEKAGAMTALAAAVHSSPQIILFLRRRGASLNDLRALQEIISATEKDYHLLDELSTAVFQKSDHPPTSRVGQNIFEKAIDQGDSQVCDILFRTDASLPVPSSFEIGLMRDAKSGDSSKMRLRLLSCSTPVSQRQLSGALLEASEAGSLPKMECLLQEIFPTDHSSDSPPHKMMERHLYR